jgi:bacterioferritin-associated ferredoxin
MADRSGSRPICGCCNVHSYDIDDAVRSGSRIPSYEGTLKKTGAAMQCGSCYGDLYQVYLKSRHMRRMAEKGQLALPFLTAESNNQV